MRGWMLLGACISCIYLNANLVIFAQNADQVVEAPLPPQEAAKSMKLPNGFRASLLAGEPDVMQPISFCIDDRGRLWVAEAYNYPKHGTGSGDRILIFEDSDGDGCHDKRTLFYDGLNYVTGIEVGFGGAWVMSPPYFYFIPDRDGDDRPDSQPELVLDGFGNHENAHNLANGFAWGPDGWLYGTHGRTNWSMVGKPGTPADQRTRFDGGVYRFHPKTRIWEAYADGSTNPWGIDWNDYGHAFVCNCVNPHLFQVIQGAHYEPWRGRESSKYAYQRIDTIADHLHYVGLSNVRRGLGSVEEDAAGGGHAHCGTMIYLGDSFPDSYRNTLFTNNIHGRRINNDLPRRSGSGYVASHGADLMRSADPWFMGVTLAYGPSGEVYVSDWSDTGECHSIRNTRRHTGRIYRITYGDRPTARVDLAKLTDIELVDLQLHKNDWYVRHARRLLHERKEAGNEMSDSHRRLFKMFDEQSEVPRKLRALWALKVTGGLEESFLLDQLKHTSEDVRSWSVTFLFENGKPSADAMDQLVVAAKSDPSGLVRLSLASGLQRLALSQRWSLTTALAGHGEDRSDQNLPLMIWYGSEPLIEDDLARFADLAASAAIPRVRINAARRIASSKQSSQGLTLLTEHLTHADDEIAADLLEGLLEGVEGQRTVRMPEGWRAAYDHLVRSRQPSIRDRAVRLALIFDDQQALKTLQQIALDSGQPTIDRSRAIEALVAKRASGFEASLINLIQDSAVRASALRGLSAYNQPQTASAILKLYSTMNSADKLNAQQTLASRVPWARELVDAIESKRIAAVDLSAFAARQIRELGDEELTAKLARCWGEVRQTPQDRAKQIASIKKWLTTELVKQADLEHGSQLFKKQCANCHKFFGEGGKIGPDITGSQRMNLDYMLENIVDPNSTVSKDYQMEVFQTDEGRVINGLVESETPEAVTIQTPTERIVIATSNIASRKKAAVSIMPLGLIDAMSDDDIRDLIGYLQRKN